MSGGCLDIRCSPALLLSLKGEKIAIPYVKAGFPVPRLIWLKRSSDNQSLYEEVSNRSASRNSTHLLLSNVTHSDSGLYQVTIGNTVGSSLQSFKLEVTSSKDAMTKCLAANNTEESCSLSTEKHPNHGTKPLFSGKSADSSSSNLLVLYAITTKVPTSATTTGRTPLDHVTLLHTTNNSFILVSQGPEGKTTTSETLCEVCIAITYS